MSSGSPKEVGTDHGAAPMRRWRSARTEGRPAQWQRLHAVFSARAGPIEAVVRS